MCTVSIRICGWACEGAELVLGRRAGRRAALLRTSAAPSIAHQQSQIDPAQLAASSSCWHVLHAHSTPNMHADHTWSRLGQMLPCSWLLAHAGCMPNSQGEGAAVNHQKLLMLQEGTRTWSAPEVLLSFADIRHAQPRISPKADVFSFGVVLWEIVVQSDPVQGWQHIRCGCARCRRASPDCPVVAVYGCRPRPCSCVLDLGQRGAHVACRGCVQGACAPPASIQSV